MAKSMPKSALPRQHPKHPSRCHVVYKTRKLLSELLEKERGRINFFYTCDKYFRGGVASRLDWLRKDPAYIKEVEFARATQDTLALPMLSFIAYRHLQQAVNRVRKLLQEYESHEIPCCAKHRLLDDTFALFSIMSCHLCHAMANRKSTKTDSQGNDKISDRNVVNFLLGQGKHLIHPDKLEMLILDVVTAVGFWDQHDSLRSLMAHFEECPSDWDKLEPAKSSTIIDQIYLHTYLTGSIDTLVPAPRCIKRSHGERNAQGLMKLVHSRHFLEDPCFFGFHQGPVRNAVRDACLIRSAPLSVPVSRLRTAVVEQVKERCSSRNMQDAVYLELLKLLEGGLQQPEQKLQISVSTSSDRFVEVTDNSINHTSKDKIVRPQEADLQISTIAKDVATNDTAEASVSLEAKMSKPRIVDGAKFPSSRLQTIGKYQARGYGATEAQVRQGPQEALRECIWIIEDRNEYYEVWRVIFPLTRNDRLVTRVSWPLFVKAMQASPLNCRIKKAADPIFVFERRNENGGKEVFECHAPHGNGWIPASDLYRYKKDLRDTFGMDADRIMLRTMNGST